MKKKLVRKSAPAKKVAKLSSSRSQNDNQTYLVVVRSWMVFVLMAVMLGLGAIVGTFFNAKLNETTPVVAGAQTAR